MRQRSDHGDPKNNANPGHRSKALIKFSCGQASDAANLRKYAKSLQDNAPYMVRKAMEDMAAPTIQVPVDLPAMATKMQETVWEANYDEYRQC